MVKFLIIAEIIIAAIYTAMKQDMRNEGISFFVGAVVGTLVVSLGIGYLVAACITRKSPRIHKIAFIVFCVFIAQVGCQSLYEQSALYEQSTLEKDLKEGIAEVDKKISTYNSATDISQIEKDMERISEGVIKEMIMGMLSDFKKINVPEPMLYNEKILHSKEKLSVAIRQQDHAIKQYKKEINSVIDHAIYSGVSSALASCEKSYPHTECKKFTDPLEKTVFESKNKIYEGAASYVDYLEEEINVMRFISNNYNKFTTSGRFPHFTDATLQNQFMSKIQALDKKSRAVADLRNNAWKNK